jgi:hypothetical protein
MDDDMTKEEEFKNLYRNNIVHMIPWKPLDPRPGDGKEIWILKYHPKCHFPSSFEIVAGEVETGVGGSWRINSSDYDGYGLTVHYPNEDFKYWCDKWEISVPEEMINWNHDSGVW